MGQIFKEMPEEMACTFPGFHVLLSAYMAVAAI